MSLKAISFNSERAVQHCLTPSFLRQSDFLLQICNFAFNEMKLMYCSISVILNHFLGNTAQSCLSVLQLRIQNRRLSEINADSGQSTCIINIVIDPLHYDCRVHFILMIFKSLLFSGRRLLIDLPSFLNFFLFRFYYTDLFVFCNSKMVGLMLNLFIYILKKTFFVHESTKLNKALGLICSNQKSRNVNK